MSGPITFDYVAWKAAYPTFAAVSQAAADSYFSQATLILRNDGTAPMATDALLTLYLYLLTAHIAWLQSPRNGSGMPDSAGTVAPSPLIGMVKSASEGSVSVSVDYGTISNNAAWFLQSQWGALYWQSTAAYRTARYMPGPRRSFEPWPRAPMGYPFWPQ